MEVLTVGDDLATIAVIDGPCAGADFERALGCDLRVAGASARLSADGAGDPEGIARRLARLLGEARAKDIVLTGRAFDAREALRLGVVTRVVEDAALPAEARALADLIASRPPLALRAVRSAVEQTRDLTLAEALALEHEHFCRLIGTRDHKAAVAAFLERRTPAFTGQ
jgi:enoyl-CoA hydratase/carnithine racemase